MTPNESFWLSFWEIIATVGFILVIIGCVIEGVEHFVKFKRGESQKRHLIEKIGWFILIGGLAMEFLGDKAAKRISDRDKARLEKETAASLAQARSAELVAAKANERAAVTESNNLVLQGKIKTRIITDDDRKDFIECLKGQPRGIVMVSFDRGASANVRFYAEEIARLLIDAGYSVPGGAEIADVKPILPADASIELWSLNGGPAYFRPLARCLEKVADNVVPNINSNGILWISTNDLWLYVANYR